MGEESLSASPNKHNGSPRDSNLNHYKVNQVTTCTLGFMPTVSVYCNRIFSFKNFQSRPSTTSPITNSPSNENRKERDIQPIPLSPVQQKDREREIERQRDIERDRERRDERSSKDVSFNGLLVFGVIVSKVRSVILSLFLRETFKSIPKSQ